MLRLRSKTPLLINMKKTSSLAQTFRLLRTKLKIMLTQSRCQTLLITSAYSGEGKTMIAANIGVAFALEGKKVLLIDANLREPKLHKVVGATNMIGLGHYLEGDRLPEVIIQETDVKNLYLLPGTITEADPSELLGSEKMDQLLREVVTKFDYILIDSPSILNVTDALVMTAKCCGTLLVVKHNKVSTDILQKVKESIECVNGKIIGSIINQADLNGRG